MENHHRPATSGRLAFFASPIARQAGRHGASESEVEPLSPSSADQQQASGPTASHSDGDFPELKRHEEPTLLEIFFDLFFAANYNVFADTQRLSDRNRSKAYVGYFSLLWLTWFLVTLFDVRFVTDSIFSRLTRIVQLGVLVGFVVVAPKFDPTNQRAETMRAMSIILSISRACLVVEYGSMAWHLRRFKKIRWHMSLQVAIHLVASIVCLSVAFRFRDSRRSRIFMTWYIISGLEAVASVTLSTFSPVLDLSKTHLRKRLVLLTVMILGDGIVQLAKAVVVIVKHPGAWDATTIGLVTAAAAAVYFIFLIYFDWMRPGYYLPARRLQFWACLHFLFHLSLVLHLQAMTQWLLWSEVWSQVRRLTSFSDPSSKTSLASWTSTMVRDSINSSVQPFLRDYPPTILSSREIINDALNNLTMLPDSFWPKLAIYTHGDSGQGFWTGKDQEFNTFSRSVHVITSTLTNALLSAFGIEVDSEVATKGSAPNVTGSALQFELQDKAWSLCRSVFAYGYISAGITIALMAVLAFISSTKSPGTWLIIRLALIMFFAVCTSLTSLVWVTKEGTFLRSPWVLPPVTIVWSIILVITHINGDELKRARRQLHFP